jgi:DNA-directed RNA polymerase subunit RPC12/RpoP
MPETFQCPECCKAYPRENRLVGRAVLCECGHRFLVPPRESRTSPSASASSLAIPTEPRQARPASGPPRSGKPLQARPVSHPPLAKPARWADPVPQDEPMPLSEADLIDEPAPSSGGAAQPAPPMARPVFPAAGQALPPAAIPLATPLPPASYRPSQPPKKRKS